MSLLLRGPQACGNGSEWGTQAVGEGSGGHATPIGTPLTHKLAGCRLRLLMGVA